MWGPNLTDFLYAGCAIKLRFHLLDSESYSWNSLVNLQIREAYLYKEEISKTFL